RMTRKKFRQVYGKDVEQNILKSTSITQSQEEIALAVQPDEADDPFNWADDESITIIDYFVRKYEKDTLYKLSNGDVLNQEEMDELFAKSREINDRNRLLDMELLPAMGGLATDGQLLSPEGAQGLESLPQDGFGVTGDHDILPQENGMDV